MIAMDGDDCHDRAQIALQHPEEILEGQVGQVLLIIS